MEIKCNTLDPRGSEESALIEVKSGNINLLEELFIKKLVLDMDTDKQNELVLCCLDSQEKIDQFKDLIKDSDDELLKFAKIIKFKEEEK